MIPREQSIDLRRKEGDKFFPQIVIWVESELQVFLPDTHAQLGIKELKIKERG